MNRPGANRPKAIKWTPGDEKVSGGPRGGHARAGEERRRAGPAQQLPLGLERVLAGHRLPTQALLVSNVAMFRS